MVLVKSWLIYTTYLHRILVLILMSPNQSDSKSTDYILESCVPSPACENFYRPQRSCEGYVFTGVCLSTVGGGWYPSMPCSRSRGGVLSQHGETATAADGTHPTGMHSCLESIPVGCVPPIWKSYVLPRERGYVTRSDGYPYHVTIPMIH